MTDAKTLWHSLRQEVTLQQQQDPLLAKFFHDSILQHDSLIAAISYLLAQKLQTNFLPTQHLCALFKEYYLADSQLEKDLCADLDAIMTRDCACRQVYQAFCFYKGFHALATYRIMHALWQQQKTVMSLQLQQRMSAVFDVDIHPAARIGHSI